MSAVDQLRPTTTWRHRGVPSSFAGISECLCFGAYEQRVLRDPLLAIVTIDNYGDEGKWLHLSVSRAGRIPSWSDLVTARDELGYREWLFVQIVAPASRWINVHRYTMHLWSRLDRETVPQAVWDQQGADGQTYGDHR